MEKLPQKDEAFEAQKKQAEEQRKKETLEDLKSRLQEIIKENPIEIKDCGHSNNDSYKFNQIKNVWIIDNKNYHFKVGFDFMEKDSGGRDYFFYVTDEGIKTSAIFENKNPKYKITKDSFENLSTMMNKLIQRSNLNDLEKNKMLQYVIDNFKDKILPTEEIEKNN